MPDRPLVRLPIYLSGATSGEAVAIRDIDATAPRRREERCRTWLLAGVLAAGEGPAPELTAGGASGMALLVDLERRVTVNLDPEDPDEAMAIAAIEPLPSSRRQDQLRRWLLAGRSVVATGRFLRWTRSAHPGAVPGSGRPTAAGGAASARPSDQCGTGSSAGGGAPAPPRPTTAGAPASLDSRRRAAALFGKLKRSVTD